MMARFFASYVSPSERPTLHGVATLVIGDDVFVSAPPVDVVEPVLPAGWTWTVEDDDVWSSADYGDDYEMQIWWDGEDRRLGHAGCHRGQFPDVERYVLWKNGVAQ